MCLSAEEFNQMNLKEAFFFFSNTESISEKERDAYLLILGKTGLCLTDRKRSFGMVFLEAKLVCPVRVCG